MTEIKLTPKTTYFHEGVELWDVRTIANEFGVVKTTANKFTLTAEFPPAYAVGATAGKTARKFYSADLVRAWAIATPYVALANARRDKGIGRPRTGTSYVEQVLAVKA